jgi:hypothetical protein
MTTLVTAFFDINRDTRGDGRTIDEYLKWIRKTLQLNCNLFIVTEAKFRHFFEENRPIQYKSQTVIKIVDFSESHYYKYYEQIQQILQSNDYLAKVKHPDRVECKLPEYNIIQYSKFHYLQMAIDQNPFQTDHFLWIDAGISRFFMDVDLSNRYPSPNGQKILDNIAGQFIIQKRQDLFSYPLTDDFVWDSANLLCGTMFGGTSVVVLKMAYLVEQVFINKMIRRSAMNNEQLAIALVWKDNKEIFCLTDNYFGAHLSLFKYLAL